MRRLANSRKHWQLCKVRIWLVRRRISDQSRKCFQMSKLRATIIKNHLWNGLGIVAENGTVQRRLNDMEGNTLEAVLSAEQLHAKVSDMNGKRDTLDANCKEFALGVHYMPGFAKNARSLRTRVAQLKKASKTKASRMRANCRTADMGVVVEQARAERVGRTAQIAQLEGYLHELNDKFDILERRNNITDSLYPIQSEECELLNC